MTFWGRILSLPFRADLQSHFFYGATLGLSALRMGWYALAVVGVGAAAKELYDAFHPDDHDAEWVDFIATMLGGCASIALITWRLNHV